MLERTIGTMFLCAIVVFFMIYILKKIATKVNIKQQEDADIIVVQLSRQKSKTFIMN